MESKKVKYFKDRGVIVGTFKNDALSSSLRVVIFPYGKIDNKFFRRLCGVDDFEYPVDYVCYGCTVDNPSENMDTIFLQKTEDGALYMDVICHETFHFVMDTYSRLHQIPQTGQGEDEFGASIMGCAGNLIYALLVRYKIPLIVG